ncbi:unnamed protein product, partial [Acanthoscelides obtectus]
EVRSSTPEGFKGTRHIIVPLSELLRRGQTPTPQCMLLKQENESEAVANGQALDQNETGSEEQSSSTCPIRASRTSEAYRNDDAEFEGAKRKYGSLS